MQDLIMFIPGRTPGGQHPMFLLYPPSKSVKWHNDSVVGSSTGATIAANTEIPINELSVVELMPYFHKNLAQDFPQDTLGILLKKNVLFRGILQTYVVSSLELQTRAYNARQPMETRVDKRMPLFLGGKLVREFMQEPNFKSSLGNIVEKTEPLSCYGRSLLFPFSV